MSADYHMSADEISHLSLAQAYGYLREKKQSQSDIHRQIIMAAERNRKKK